MENNFHGFTENMRIMCDTLCRALNNNLDPLNVCSSLRHVLYIFISSPEKLSYYCQKYAADVAALAFCRGAQKPSNDHRFTDAKWHNDPYYRSIKDAFLFNSQFFLDVVQKESASLNHTERQRVIFLARLIVESCAPNNYLFFNPEFISEFILTKGRNVVSGLENFLEDCLAGRMTTAARDTFVVGKDVAVTPGNVVFKNYLFELIHYSATAEKTYAVPILIIPPWINKYYILDLRPENSYVRWLLDAGYDVYVISWVNPDKSMKGVTFDNYACDGALQAWKYVASRHKKVQLMGYCLGGTLATILLSMLAAKKEDHRVAATTLLATLIDFADVGDFAVLMSDEQISAFSERVRNSGYVSGLEMYYVFSLMRSRDMIWKTAVERYLLGRSAPHMDILAWNSDTTNLPAEMSIFYLLNFYRENNLIKPNKLTVGDVNIDIRSVKTPSFCVAAANDHIVPWHTSYSGALRLPNTKFVLTDSGHIAGIINPPNAHKYCFWTNDNMDVDPNVWLMNAQKQRGSWWTEWLTWNQQYAGKLRKAPAPKRETCLYKAPGEYVLRGI
jgi:polyhydroxyalkanoate synthase